MTITNNPDHPVLKFETEERASRVALSICRQVGIDTRLPVIGKEPEGLYTVAMLIRGKGYELIRGLLV